MNYGSLIDETYTPDRQYIYDMFVEYFGNPILTKVKDQNNLSMYAVKNYCLTATSCRYIVVFTTLDYNMLGTDIELKDLNWVSLQTRTLENSFNNVNIRTHGYTPEESGPLTCKINRTEVTKDVSVYSCEEYPLIITLLHTPKKPSSVYQPRGNIVIALETWETIITFSD